jgi:hypothetical protein
MADFLSYWRRGWDSNPRYGLSPYNGLANRRLQPLGHPSSRKRSMTWAASPPGATPDTSSMWHRRGSLLAGFPSRDGAVARGRRDFKPRHPDSGSRATPASNGGGPILGRWSPLTSGRDAGSVAEPGIAPAPDHRLQARVIWLLPALLTLDEVRRLARPAKSWRRRRSVVAQSDTARFAIR